jgi:arginase
LRAAGLVARLEAAGFQVNDLGDGPLQMYAADEEHPRARNAAAVVEGMSALRLRVEQAVKSGALALVLGGDCSITPGTIAGARRYYREVGLLWLDRDADLNTPASTPSGCLHGMTVAHITGRGAPEMVRFYTDAPLVRDPSVALYGLDRLDPFEEELLRTTPIRSYRASDIMQRGVAATARAALDRIHAGARAFVLHFDVDVIAGEDFSACAFPGTGGLRLDDVRQVLELFVPEPQLLALEIAEYMPERDADGSAANLLVELIVTALSRRLAALTAPKAVVQTPEAQKEAQTQEAQSQGAALAESEPAQSSESSTLIAEATAGDSSSNSSS